ncbi:12176_t:CDS:2 [Entrophospora sp. SA101]|nr:6927_t:CDS:2 [Entrophospora sp. SA101]CAJ0912037.1 17967_t:CDS:2 [Entrophospora sp. SA101]CAJ0915694.1 12176_t:CDS:2 [Entrophospora sp. SA101]
MPLKKDRSRRNLDQNRSEICEADISRHNGGYRHSSSLMEIIVSVVRCRDVLERETSSPVAIKTTTPKKDRIRRQIDQDRMAVIATRRHWWRAY